MRKFLAIFLTVAMLASFAVVPAFAAAGKVYDVPADYITPKDYTDKLATITDSGTTFKLTAADSTEAVKIVSADVTGGFKADIDSDGGLSVLVTRGTAAPGTVAALTLKSATDAQVATIYLQAASADSDVELTSIAIKQPATNVIVSGGKLKLEIEKTPKDHNEDIFWFTSSSVVTLSATPNNTITLDAGAVTSTTAVTIKAVSRTGKTAETVVFVVPGVTATGVSFTKSVYEHKANVGSSFVAETVVAPSNGITKDRTVSVPSLTPTDTTDGVKTYSVDSGKLVFTLDNLGEIKIKAADSAGSYPYALVFEVDVPTGATTSVKGQTVVSFTKPDTTATGRKIQLEGKPTSGKLAIGQKFEYKAVVYDMDPAYKAAKVVKDAKVEWFSTNPSVASVDKTTGVVTAVKEGTATIIAVSEGAKAAGSDTELDVRATLTVVKEAAKGEVKFVKASTLNVRAFANSSAIKIGELKQGDLVEVTEVTGAWAKINFNGGVAYVADAYLITPVNFTVTSSKLAVRSFPGATAAVKELVYGDTVKAIGELASNKAWTIIVLDDTTVAYVASKYVTEGTQVGIVTSSTLTMRVSASTTSAAYANKLVKGQTVEILGKEGAFLKVKTAEGFVGYAAAAYITIF